tara:strand:- start:269 stop:1945 length:1677 start_codon:yes stop_codon:yes gene_type:complete
MAIIFSYPPIKSTNVNSSDKLIISQMNTDGNPTKTISISELSKAIASGAATGGPYLPLTAGPTVPLTGDLYMAPNGAGPSVGSKNIVFRGIDDLGNELDGGRIFTQDSTIAPSGQDLVFQNADDNGVLQTNLFLDAFGQVGIQKTNPNFGLDVGGSGNFDTTLNVGGNVQFGGTTDFRFFQATGSIGLGTSSPNFKMDIAGGDLRMEENYGIRFGGTGSNGQNWNIRTTGDPFGGNYPGTFMIGRGGDSTNPYFQITTGPFAPSNPGQITFNQYGSGNFTGTAAYALAVDANGNIIEETSPPIPTFDSANSSATGRIRIGATASAASTSTDAVFIGSALTNTNNGEQINIGYNNDGAGTQNMIYGSNNTQTGNGAYSILIGTLNQAASNTSLAIGRNNTLNTGDTFTIGQSNQSSFTGGASSAGLMNISIGEDNQLDVDKGAVFGFANDVTGSFGWTIGGGNETVVIGNRLTMSLLGPNRSATTGPRVIIATGEFIGAGPENKKNSVEYYTPEASRSGVFHPALYSSASYADDTAAAAGGVRLGELYRNGSVIQIRMT